MAYRFKVTIDGSKIAGTQTNFPVLVSDLVSSIPAGFFSAIADAAGLDIMVIGVDGAEYAREIAFLDAGNSKIELWVKIPSMTNGVNFSFWVYSGTGTTRANDATVWSNGFLSVYHLNEASGALADSKGVYAGTNTGFTYGAASKIQKGLDGAAADIATFQDQPVNSVANLTLSCWLKGTSWGSNYLAWEKYKDANNRLAMLLNSLNVIFGFSNSNYVLGPDTHSTNWEHHVFAYDGSQVAALDKCHYWVNNTSRLNGSAGTIPATTSNLAGVNLAIGAADGSSAAINGIYDEARVATVTRDANWVATEYNNQSDPDAFADAGDGATETPNITGISPAFGGIAGGAAITITGTSFGPAEGAVTIGGNAATVTSWTDTQIVVTAPAHAAGLVSIVVTALFGGTDTEASGFAYDGTPSIAALSSSRSLVSGGAYVTLSGSGFAATQGSNGAVLMDGTACTISAWSDTSITFLVPPHAAGAVQLVVRNRSELTSASQSFRYGLGAVSAPPVNSIGVGVGLR